MPHNAKRPLVIVTRKLPDVVETRMRELFDARLNVDDKPMSQAQLVEAAQAADVLVPTVTDRIDRAVLAQAGPRLNSSPISARASTTSISIQRAIGGLLSPIRQEC